MIHFLLLVTLSFTSTVYGGSPAEPIDQFTKWDTQHNRDYPREPKTSVMEHLLIPLDHPNLYSVDTNAAWRTSDKGPNGVVLDFASYLPKHIRDLLVIERDGKRFLRFFISPGDTKYHLDVENYLNSIEVPFERESLLMAQRSASRSMIVTDPDSGKSFSLKVATNERIGFHTNDPVPMYWAHLNRRVSDYYYAMREHFKYLDIAWEAATVGFPAIDLGYQIRLMEAPSEGKEYHGSLFVLQDKTEVKRLAGLAGMDEDAFMRKIVYAQGRAYVEMSAILGFFMTSAHEQNARFVLDSHFRPLDRAVILDLTDGRFISPIVVANGAQDLLKEWEDFGATSTNPILKDEFKVANFFYKGFEGPYQDTYAEAIADGLKELTTIDHEKIEQLRASMKATNRHSQQLFSTPITSATEFLKWQPPSMCEQLKKAFHQ